MGRFTAYILKINDIALENNTTVLSSTSGYDYLNALIVHIVLI